MSWINEKALPYMRAWAKDRDGFPYMTEDHEVSVSGDGFYLRANPRASHGYLYLCAGPDARATEPTPVFRARPVNDSRSRCKRCRALSGAKHRADCPSAARVLARQAREGGPRDPDRRVLRKRRAYGF